MSINDDKSIKTQENKTSNNEEGFLILKEYENMFKETDQYQRDMLKVRDDLDIIKPNSLFMNKVKFTMMGRILAQRHKNTREQNMKKVYSIVKQYLKDKRGIKGFYKQYFKAKKIKFNQQNLKDVLNSVHIKEEVYSFLKDDIAFKNYTLQYIGQQAKNFVQNYKINFQKYLFAGNKEAFLEYLQNPKKAKYPWTYKMVEKAKKQFLDFFFKDL